MRSWKSSGAPVSAGTLRTPLPNRSPTCLPCACSCKKKLKGSEQKRFFNMATSPRESQPPNDARDGWRGSMRSEEHTSELQSRSDIVCRLLLEKKKKIKYSHVRETAPQAHVIVRR